jgi:hypothetical protein
MKCALIEKFCKIFSAQAEQKRAQKKVAVATFVMSKTFRIKA